MAKTWFESEFGKSKTVTPPIGQLPSAVNGDSSSIDGYYFDQVFQIIPTWTQAEMSQYLSFYPIVIVPVRPIAFLDALNQQYLLVVFRDSTNQISAKLQVYDVLPQYKQAHPIYDVNDFSGVLYQIALNGKVQDVLGFENGQFKTRITLTPNENLGRFRATSRGICADMNTTNPQFFDYIIIGLCRLFGKGDGGGRTGASGQSNSSSDSGLSYSSNISYGGSANGAIVGGGGSSSLGGQIDNTIFTETQLRNALPSLNFTPDEIAIILENKALKTRVTSYFKKRNPRLDDVSIASAVKNHLLYADNQPDILNRYLDLLINNDVFFRTNNKSNFPLKKYLDSGLSLEEFSTFASNDIIWAQVDVFMNNCGFNSTSVEFLRNISRIPLDDSEGYPVTHPVVIALRAFNEQIWWAFEGSNNISTRGLHQTAKGVAGADGYPKCIGAIGEGIFGTRILTGGASLTGSSLWFGHYYSGYAHDLIQVTNLYQVRVMGAQAKFELKVNFTDQSGNSLSTPVTVSRNNSGIFSTLVTLGKISYEVKTIDPTSTLGNITSAFNTGVQQVIDRSMSADIDAGVLVFDKDAFNKIKHLPSVQTEITRLTSTKNAGGEQISFLRLESDLSFESKRAYHSIVGKIKNLTP